MTLVTALLLGTAAVAQQQKQNKVVVLQIATLATRHGIATSSANRPFVEVGGLMSYGTDVAEVWQALIE